jgi:hypothetical protein
MSSEPSGLVITMTDIIKAGYCGQGARRWFHAKELDFRGFLKNGIPAEDLIATGDAMAFATVEKRIERDWLAGGAAELIVTSKDLKDSRMCAAGARGFAAKNKLDYQSFVDRGISAKALIETGDRNALRLIREKLERERG